MLEVQFRPATGNVFQRIHEAEVTSSCRNRIDTVVPRLWQRFGVKYDTAAAHSHPHPHGPDLNRKFVCRRYQGLHDYRPGMRQSP